MRSILIRMPNWLGDAVMATPLLEDIKACNPSSELTVICQPAIEKLLENNPHIDHLISFPKNIQGQAKSQLINALKEKKFDTAILATRSFSSAYMFWKAKIPIRIGYRDHFRSLLLYPGISLPRDEEHEHQVITYKRLLQPLGIGFTISRPKLVVTQDELDQAWKILNQAGIAKENLIVGINPGAAYGSAKCWIPERFSEVVQKLLEQGIKVVLFGDNSTKPLVDQIHSSFATNKNVLNLAGSTDLRTFMALISQLSCFLTNDSGPMHIAAALDIPQVAIFGSTNEVKTGPYSSKAIVVHKHVACSPCYLRTCPIDLRCMKEISSLEVFRHIQTQLELN